VLGLDGTHRMNVPGTLGAHSGSWRFEWPWIGSEATRVLGLITAASGRAPIGRVGLPG
jgi:4-alpha-glucanotransferase